MKVTRAAREAENSTTLDRLARVGLFGWGVTHLLVAWLALQIAWGGSNAGEEGDQAGALSTIAEQPFGEVLLIVLAIGFAALAVWQALEAAIGHRGDDGPERLAERVASGARAVIYGSLAWSALQATIFGDTSKAQKQQSATASLMSEPAGRWLVGAIGVGVIVFAVGLAWYGLSGRYFRHLKPMDKATRHTTEVIGRIGYVAKAVAYGIAGFLVVTAAVTFDPAKARGLDAALRTLVAQPYGRILLTVVTIGIAAYGVFCFVQVKYRKV